MRLNTEVEVFDLLMDLHSSGQREERVDERGDHVLFGPIVLGDLRICNCIL